MRTLPLKPSKCRREIGIAYGKSTQDKYNKAEEPP